MKRSLAAVPCAVLLLAGCGTGDTCQTNPAALRNQAAGCSSPLAAGQQVTFNVALNCNCTESSPSCQAEFVNGGIEVAPVFQQCQADAACGGTPGCAITQPTATCSVTLPASVSGQVQLTVIGAANPVQGTVTVASGGATSCNL